ncbi:esterase-like activity of phytase family protein [Halopseudomonas phragmitis]|uniref:esterase-like activity of phytase family protein n=1 Tax=Halopseudomonas phragmitis TaxID=1931241 RepID=UPI0012BA97A0|nr:esterase-like activity of phytase family protein [Halopseudomonas phragmitis]
MTGRPLLALLAASAVLYTGGLGAFERAPELTLEHALAVDGIARGNLSGLARCGDRLLAVSDREDSRLYQLEPGDRVWQAEPENFTRPEQNPSMLPVPLLAGAWLRGLRGQALDFEGISCDAEGNRYLLSESLLGILKLPPPGEDGPVAGVWLELAEELYSEGESRGLWQQINALAEGIAVAGDGKTLWLAAERQSRGLVRLELQDGRWQCPLAGCVLLAERRYLPPEPFGPGVLNREVMALDFAGLSLWQGRLWTLERNEHQVCRRHPLSGQRERCWSFAATLLSVPYVYPKASFGLAEAIHVDEQGILIGLDNNALARADGDTRPWLFHFSLPDDWQQGYGR